jgi:dihydroorotate dehydrogenase
MIFFALTGKQTFYNRYGFINKRFDRYLEKLKRKKLRGIIDKDIRANSLTLSPGKALPLALIRRLIDSKFLDMPLPEVAQFVIDTCKKKSKSTKSISLVNDIIQFFKKKIIIENQFEYVIEITKSRSKTRSKSRSKTRSKTRSKSNTLRSID